MALYRENGVEYEAIVLSLENDLANISAHFPHGWVIKTRARQSEDGFYEQAVFTIRHPPPPPGQSPIGNVERERTNWGDKKKAEQGT